MVVAFNMVKNGCTTLYNLYKCVTECNKYGTATPNTPVFDVPKMIKLAIIKKNVRQIIRQVLSMRQKKLDKFV